MLGNESILAVDYRIDGETLYRYHAKTVERIVPWGPQAEAWRLSGAEWQPFVPEIDIGFVEENAWHPGPHRWPSWRRRVAACRFLIDRWPEEARGRVRGFPSAHWQLLQLVNAGGPPALDLLCSNPALGYLAAMAGAASRIGLRRRSLAALFGFPETEHAVRILRKVPAQWISCDFLAQLRTAITTEPGIAAVLTHLPRINPIALEVARDTELRASVAPDCMTRLSRLSASAASADLVARLREVPRKRIRSLADFDRSTGAPRGAARAPRVRPAGPADAAAFPAPLVERDPPAALAPPPISAFPDLEPPAFIARVRAPAAPLRPRRRATGRAFPAPPLPDVATGGVQISAIRSQPDLAAESDAMHHCAGRDRRYARRVADGSVYFYRMLAPERLTIAIRPAGCSWAVEEIRGVCNRLPCDASRMLIWNWIRQSTSAPCGWRMPE